MRKSAYLRAVAEAKALPTGIPELRTYFCDGYDPRALALAHIARAARQDEGLFDGETVEILRVIRDEP